MVVASSPCVHPCISLGPHSYLSSSPTLYRSDSRNENCAGLQTQTSTVYYAKGREVQGAFAGRVSERLDLGGGRGERAYGSPNNHMELEDDM